MVFTARQHFTFDEYISLEEISRVKHEFLDGQAWAMSGGSPEHARIAGTITRLIGNRLAGKPCDVFSSDLRVRVAATGLATYPDVTVICGRIELDPEDRRQQTASNPSVVLEVLSLTTQAYDRGEKLEHYKRVPSLREIVLVAHDEHRLEIWRREADVWTLEVSRGAAAVAHLRTLDVALPLCDVYRTQLAS